MKKFNPFAVWENAAQLSFLMAEAQAVIAMRLMGMAGFWSVTKSENNRMVSEKVHAMTKAVTDSQRAAMAGQSPDKIMAAAIRPVRSATRANSRRLAKRGPKRT